MWLWKSNAWVHDETHPDLPNSLPLKLRDDDPRLQGWKMHSLGSYLDEVHMKYALIVLALALTACGTTKRPMKNCEKVGQIVWECEDL